MKRLFFISLLIAILLPLTTSCEKDEVQTSEKSGNQNGQGGQNEGNNQDDSTSPIIVTVDANGNADGGHRFVKIDDTNFYIDDIKYTISSENLIVTGYEASFSGMAKIISQLNHEGREMYVIGIEEKAFEGCTDLTSVTIPSSVTNIGSGAFYNCTGLTHVYCYAGRVPSTKADAFEYSNIVNATLHVPTSAINAYRNTAPWSDFRTIVAIQ